MNLLDIRTRFIQENGRYDLVSDRTTFANDGADFFIRAGQRFLDSVIPNRKTLGRYITDISESQGSVLLENVRYIDSVWIKEDGEEREELERKAYSWILGNYGDDFGEKAKGLATFSGNPSDGDTITINTTTYTFGTDFDLGSDLSETITNFVSYVNSNSDDVNAYKTGSTTAIIEYDSIGTSGNSITFTSGSGDITVDGATLGTLISGRDNDITSDTPLYFAPVISTPHPDLSASDLGTDETHDLIFGVRKYAKDGILLAPPADQAYTLVIYGAYFSVLENDLDTSYHSEMYPELLIMASNLALEVFHRNSAGFNDWMNSMRPWLDGIDRDLVEAELRLAGNTLKG